jgi:ArsR family transcriptional regulator, lead/cadmium/zinc/bismuth-responsive transcriptional repressor
MVPEKKCCDLSAIKELAKDVPADEEIARLAELVKALSDPTRIKIVYALDKKELCVCELMAILKMPQPMVSHHCKILKYANIITDTKSGRWVNYALVDKKTLKALNVLRSD